jgi:hypothetical protein
VADANDDARREAGRPGASGWDEGEEGEVLAVLPAPGRNWPDVVVTLPGGQVATWRRWFAVPGA